MTTATDSAIQALEDLAEDRKFMLAIKDAMDSQIDARTGTLQACGLYIDHLKQRVDAEAWNALFTYADAIGLQGEIDRLFAGDVVNPSEARAALHWALRGASPDLPETERTQATRGLDAAKAWAAKIVSGEITAASGEPFQAVLHVGIGGSDFGPRLLADAMAPHLRDGVDLRFLANIDPADFTAAVKGLDPARTLVVGVSKSFGTEETLYNLDRCKDWLETAIGKDALPRHLALVTSATETATEWAGDGVALFDLPDSVGGRYSVWSAASLSCEIAFGSAVMDRFRAGAYEMDTHARTTALRDSLPVRLALLDVWNASFLDEPMRVVLTYAHRFRLLATYLQQLEMESNGKQVSPDGQFAPLPTAPAVWGGEGTIGQHSYHQWLHQGRGAPVEFLLALDPRADKRGNRALAAHALAQARALLDGRSAGDIDEADEAVLIQKIVPGDRASTFILAPDTSPETLGKLIALYEHRTYCAGRLWGLNPFDQWGVELGKVMAGGLNRALGGEDTTAGLDASSEGLLSRLSGQLRD